MALFCEGCIKTILGVKKETHPEWLIDFDGDICEGCRYEYLEDKEVRKSTK